MRDSVEISRLGSSSAASEAGSGSTRDTSGGVDFGWHKKVSGKVWSLVEGECDNFSNDAAKRPARYPGLTLVAGGTFVNWKTED